MGARLAEAGPGLLNSRTIPLAYEILLWRPQKQSSGLYQIVSQNIFPDQAMRRHYQSCHQTSNQLNAGSREKIIKDKESRMSKEEGISVSIL